MELWTHGVSCWIFPWTNQWLSVVEHILVCIHDTGFYGFWSLLFQETFGACNMMDWIGNFGALLHSCEAEYEAALTSSFEAGAGRVLDSYP